MFEKFTPDNDKRGQVGIGTLIVFIAMVLVAAIAAGVLVNTAGLLQSTAEDTGEQSIEKVTNRVEVVNAYGLLHDYNSNNLYNPPDDGINLVTLNVRLAAGSDAVDLSDVTIRYLSESKATTLTYSETATTSQDTNDLTGSDFMVREVKDDDTSLPVFNDRGDRFEITLDASKIEDTDDTDPYRPLGEDVTVQLEITTKTGGTTLYIFTTPDAYVGRVVNGPIKL